MKGLRLEEIPSLSEVRSVVRGLWSVVRGPWSTEGVTSSPH